MALCDRAESADSATRSTKDAAARARHGHDAWSNIQTGISSHRFAGSPSMLQRQTSPLLLTMNSDVVTNPGMPSVKHLAHFGPVGVPSPRCTMACAPIRCSIGGRRTRLTSPRQPRGSRMNFPQPPQTKLGRTPLILRGNSFRQPEPALYPLGSLSNGNALRIKLFNILFAQSDTRNLATSGGRFRRQKFEFPTL